MLQALSVARLGAARPSEAKRQIVFCQFQPPPSGPPVSDSTLLHPGPCHISLIYLKNLIIER